jgi:hypothetical protein
MRESHVRRVVIEILRPLAAFAVESSTSVGQPDVCCAAGWIELKVASRPERHATAVVFGLRSTQRVWLRRWTRSGGRAWTLCVLDATWFLHDGAWAADHLDHCGEIALQHAAIKVWHGSRPTDLGNVLVRECRKI